MNNKTFIHTIARAALTLTLALLSNINAWAVDYIDENGKEQTCTEDYDLKDFYDMELTDSWYYVEDDLTINNSLQATCDINLILCDGATLTITCEGRAIDFNGHSLTIYGQSAGTGRLIATSTEGSGIDTFGGNLTINGGTVEVTSECYWGIKTGGGSLTLNGGYLKATGGDGAPGIEVMSGSITLNGGAVKASGYSVLSDQITIADGKTFYDDMGNSYTGTINLRDVDLNNRVLSTYGGTCGSPNVNNGEDVTWYYNIDTKALTISGTGAMNNYNSTNQPWKAFMSSITSVSIGDGVTRIGNGAFEGCTNLATVSGGDGVTYIGSSAFVNTAWDNGLTDGLTMVGSVAYRFVGGDTSVNLPEGTTQIYDRAFEGSAITIIIIPASVTSIGNNAFYPSALQKVYCLATTPPTLANYAFEESSTLTIVVPEESYSSYVGDWYSYRNYLKRGYTVTCGEGITATSYAPIVAEFEQVTLQNADPSAPLGYKYGFTVKDANDNDITADNLSGNTLTMPDNNVTVSSNTSEVCSTGQAVSVSYIDENGESQTAQAIALDGTEPVGDDNAVNLPAGTYFVGLPTVSFNHTLALTGDVTLILADGCQMNIGSDEDRINGVGIYGFDDANGGEYALTITSQSLGTGMGTLSIYTTGGWNYAIDANALTINGGNITADTNGDYAYTLDATTDITINGGNVRANATGEGSIAIYNAGNFTYSGGNLTATATGIDGNAIYADGLHYTFNWRTPDDRITIGASGLFAGYDSDDPATVTFTSLFTDGTHIYSGTLTGEEIAALADVTLYPYVENLTLAARQAPDQNYWTTFYCGHTDYEINADENACAYTATYGGSQLTLHKLGKQIPAGMAVIIVADNDEVSMTAATTLPAFSGDNDLRGVDVDTDVDDITSALGDGTFYVLGMTTVNGEQHFGFHRYMGEEMAAHKAFVFVGSSPAQSAPSLTMVFDEASGIESLTPDAAPKAQAAEHWFTLDGRRLQAKPTAPGIYINNGKKVVIK